MTRLLLPLFLALLMAGCAHDTQIHRESLDATARTEAAARSGRSVGEVIYRKADVAWLGDQVIPHAVESADSVPPAALDKSVSIAIDGTLTLQVFAGMIQEAIGIPVVLSSDIAADDAKGTVVLLPDQAKVREYLNHATSQTGTHWSYESNRIVLSRLITKTFTVPALPVASGLKGTITNATSTTPATSGGGGGGQGGQDSGQGAQGGVTGDGSGIAAKLETNQVSETTVELDPWADLKAALDQLKTKEGSVAVSPALGTVTVRDTPDALRSIETFLTQITESMTRFVAIDVTILSVDTKDSNAVGIDWNLIRAAAGDFYGAEVSGSNDGPLSALRGGLTVIDPRSPFADSSVFIEALREQGTVNVERTTTLTALSNQVASLQKAQERGFIQSSQQTVVPNVGVTTSATVSRMTTGISLDVLPQVLPNQMIHVLIQGQLSTDDGDDSLAVGGSSFSSPRTSKGAFSNRAMVPSGGTLVLSSIDETSVKEQQRGVGHPSFALLGGGRNTARERRLLVILITPRRIG